MELPAWTCRMYAPGFIPVTALKSRVKCARLAWPDAGAGRTRAPVPPVAGSGRGTGSWRAGRYCTWAPEAFSTLCAVRPKRCVGTL